MESIDGLVMANKLLGDENTLTQDMLVTYFANRVPALAYDRLLYLMAFSNCDLVQEAIKTYINMQQRQLSNLLMSIKNSELSLAM